jgi:hypothetical protein
MKVKEIHASNKTIHLGYEVKDIISGFTGTATARVEYVNGCVQWCISPKIGKDGVFKEARYFDEKQVLFVGEGVSDMIHALATGGPQSNTPPTSHQP